MSRPHRKPLAPTVAIAALPEPEPAVVLAPVTIQAVAAKGMLSWFIEHEGYGFKGWSHVDIVLPDERLLGARTDYPVNGKTGVQIREPNYAAKDWTRRVRVSFMVPEAVAKDAYDFALDQQGDPYAKQDIADLAFGVKDIQHGKWICSWLAAAFLGKAKAIHYPGMPLSQISPDVLVACACSAGGKREEMAP